MKHFFTSLLLLIVCSVNAQLESVPSVSENTNWTSSIFYDFNGITRSKGVSYFNSLGKPTQNQSWDISTQMVWAQEIRYDAFNRPVLKTLTSPINTGVFGYKTDFIKLASNAVMQLSDYDAVATVNSPPQIGSALGTLGRYYSSSNTNDPYQDITVYPYTRTVMSELNPGTIKAVYGGKKVTVAGQQQWLQQYSFNMPLEVNTTAALNYEAFKYKKISKTVSRDISGIESVTFTDTEGNVVGSARSGNEPTSTPILRQVYSEITHKGFVDIHIPTGCSLGTVSIPVGASLRVFNLITEEIITNYTGLGPGFYRFEDINKHFSKNIGAVPVKINYSVNYYDYSFNEYDYADRLISTTQPLGSQGNSPLKSSFVYNSLGQLLSASSPDEGISSYKYRKDGQIRFSQNAKQVKNNSFSYTNYDVLGRPVESGVYKGFEYYFSNPLEIPERVTVDELIDLPDGLPEYDKKEQNFSVYDLPDSQLASALNDCSIPASRYIQTFLSGNVSYTYTSKPETSKTWYSYDVYGRVKWVIQLIGNCHKTIDYTYDPVDGALISVEYQKHIPAEQFTHQYTYNTAGQLENVYTRAPYQPDFSLQAHYIYNYSGQLIRTEIAEDLQGIDYVYNLSGQLKAINHPSIMPENDKGADGVIPGIHGNFAPDVFGMAIDYFDGDYSRTGTPKPVTTSAQGVNQYNGNIKATRWNTQIANASHSAYTYQYNKNNWLAEATFGSANNSAVITPNTQSDYKLSGITYDANGNILTMNRKGYTDGAGSNQMDNFSYRYAATGTTLPSNRLLSVKDTQDNTDPLRYNDIKNQDLTVPTGVTGQNASLDMYTYNELGQMIANYQDKTLYQYNTSGLVEKIKVFSDKAISMGVGFNTLVLNDYNQLPFENHGWKKPTGSITQGLATITCSNTEYLDLSDRYKSALELNGDGYSYKQLRVTPSTHFNLEFDLLLDKQTLIQTDGPPLIDPVTGQQTPPTAISSLEPKVVVNLKKPDGTVFYTTTINPQPATYCDRYIAALISHDFISGPEQYITIELQISSNLPTSPPFPRRNQKVLVDNLRLSAAVENKLEFVYNERGHRIRKISLGGGSGIFTIPDTFTDYIRDISGNTVSVHSYTSDLLLQSTSSEFPIYGLGRIGVCNSYYAKRGTLITSYSYELTDNLGNVRAVIMKSAAGVAALSSKGDYYPFGMPMPNQQMTSINYRYAFQGQENDPETGMEAFELRLWDGRLGRWLTVDPYNEFYSPYVGMGNNPISLTDPDGGSTDCDGCPTGAGKGDQVSHKDWGLITSDGQGGWSSATGGYIMDDVVVNAPKAAASWSFTFKDPFPNFKWDWFENLQRSDGTTIWGPDRAGDTSGLNGTTAHSIESDDILAPGGGGGALSGLSGFSFAARFAAKKNTVIIITKDITGFYQTGESLGEQAKKHMDEYNADTIEDEAYDTIYHLHSFKYQANRYESVRGGANNKKFLKQNPDYHVYDTRLIKSKK